MTSSEFSLDRTARNIPPISQDGVSAEIGTREFEAVFELLDEEIFLVERVSGDIQWMSPACRTVNHKLGSSRNIDEFPQLKRIVHATLPDLPYAQRHARWHSTEATWQQHIGDDERAKVSVFCRAGDPNNIWVRFTHFSDRDDYFRQYIADRDKLFSTSRTISVGEMVTTLAHELNQPLGSLRNIIHGIRSRLSGGGSHDDEILHALQLAEKQGQFASDVLDRARSFAKSRQPVIGRFDLNELVRDTLKLLDWIFEAESVSVSVNFNAIDTDVVIDGDSTLLQQVLMNLLRNAVESMSAVTFDAHMISITAQRDNDGVKLEIADTGEGIDEQHEEALFTPFRSQKTDGMGVGLNICRSFIELHAGKFWFTRNEVRGSTAHIFLPNRREHAARRGRW